MSANEEKLKGAAQELKGKIKGAVGDALNDEQIEAEGRAEELEGQGRQAAARGAERVRGAAEQIGGGIKHAVGDLVDDPQLQAEGEAERLKGQARQRANE